MRLLDSPKTLCSVFLIVIAIPALTYTSYTLNYHKQSAFLEDKASNITHDVGEKIAEIKTLMAALVGLHYASNEADSNEFLLFARELREQAQYVTGIGRYELVTDADRASFEARMSEKGLFDFKIKEITSNGQTSARASEQLYFPISILEPMDPRKLRLLGADLGTIPNLTGMLRTLAKTNNSLLTSFPSYWPSSGELIFFRPVYRGKHAPEEAEARLQQAAGGFWISIDIAQLLSLIASDLQTFDITINVGTTSDRTNLYSHLGERQNPTYLQSLYPRKVFTESWVNADTSLVITLRQNLGFSKEALLYTITALVSIMLVTVLYTVYVLAQRKALRDQQSSRDALFEEREKAETTLNTVQDAIITLDSSMRIVQINPAASVQFNAKASTTIGRPLSNIIKLQQVGDQYTVFNIEAALNNLESNSKGEFDVTPVGSNHDDLILRLTLTNSSNHDGTVTGHVMVLRDISHERRLTKKLAFQANHDALTGCTNRHYFEQKLAALIDELPFTESTHALCYMDLDQFKVINDTCGHRAGDRLLTELTENLRALTNEGDVLSRLGGDEFGLLMVNANQEECARRSERIFDFFQNYIFTQDDNSFAVRASIGIVHIDQTCNNMKDVLASADIACYTAKDSGRNSMYVYSKTDDTMAERSVELSWLPRLQNALTNDEFRLNVQPIAAVSTLHTTGEIEHFEFLLRLANPDGSESTPWQFIQAAERYDLMRDIDRWVIRNALQTVANLQGGPAEHCSFSINVSGQSAADPNLKVYIKEQLDLFKVDPSLIWFELTETAAISHFSVAVDLIESIRSFGCKVALDDFGSGLSSFGYLKNLPVDIIKIDGQFVKEIAKNLIDREMVRAIHQVGLSMGIQTVAEFVENQAIIDVLAEIGVHYAQGYQIGKPCNIDTALQEIPCLQKAA